MAHLHASVAIGTAAMLLATLLLLLRSKARGRRPLVALARRWMAARTRTSSLVLVLLTGTAAFCLAAILVNEDGQSVRASALGAFADAPSGPGLAFNPEERSRHPPRRRLGSPSRYPTSKTMIAQLVARLAEQPDDVKGWKMLAWAYLNTDRPEEAVRAYETALKLKPGDVEIQKGLETAKSAQTATTATPPSGTAP